MKITKTYLKNLIQEELEKIEEGGFENDPYAGLEDVMQELRNTMSGVGGRNNLKILTDAGIRYLTMIQQNGEKGMYDTDALGRKLYKGDE